MCDVPARLQQPRHMPDLNWEAILAEEDRLHHAIDRSDESEVIGQAKALVEAIARVAKEVAGEPAEANAPFEQVVNRAHRLLQTQPGHDLTGEARFSAITSSAVKMAASLGKIRNEYGTGHGRSRAPDIVPEMTALALDGAMIWSRWAVRRLGWFAFGRPGTLIDDLTQGGLFTRGLLGQRLKAANLPELEPQHQRALGTAVGQRAASGTFVVAEDGVLEPIRAGELNPWTREFRLGVATGLREDVTGRAALSVRVLERTRELLDPIEDASDWVEAWADEAEASGHLLLEQPGDEAQVRAFLSSIGRVRPEPERRHWQRLAVLETRSGL